MDRDKKRYIGIFLQMMNFVLILGLGRESLLYLWHQNAYPTIQDWRVEIIPQELMIFSFFLIVFSVILRRMGFSMINPLHSTKGTLR